jgi:hypothetical protein
MFLTLVFQHALPGCNPLIPSIVSAKWCATDSGTLSLTSRKCLMEVGSGGFWETKLMSRAQDLKQKKHNFNIIRYNVLGPIFHFQAPFPSAEFEVA